MLSDGWDFFPRKVTNEWSIFPMQPIFMHSSVGLGSSHKYINMYPHSEVCFEKCTLGCSTFQDFGASQWRQLILMLHLYFYSQRKKPKCFKTLASHDLDLDRMCMRVENITCNCTQIQYLKNTLQKLISLKWPCRFINLGELKNHDLDEYNINYSISRHKETLINFIWL